MNNYATKSTGLLNNTNGPKSGYARTIAITSGKNGMGKTNFAVNVALELAMRRRSVTLLNADLALANADLLLGINSPYNVGHILSGQCRFNDVAVKTSYGMNFLPGSSQQEDLGNLMQRFPNKTINELEMAEGETDFIFIDTPSGISASAMAILCSASEVVVLATPDPTTIVDAYAAIKGIHKNDTDKLIWVAVNNVISIRDGEDVFKQLETMSKRFLNHPIKYLGAVPEDTDLAKAVSMQKPVIEYAPSRPASRSFRIIADYLDVSDTSQPARTNSFWRSLIEQDL